MGEPGISRAGLVRYLSVAVWLLALAATVYVTQLSIARFSQQQQEQTEQAQPTALPPDTTAQTQAESTLLFSVPVSGDTRPFAGFSVAPDGTFWIGDTASLQQGDSSNRLLHYSPSGDLLDTLNLPATISELSDLELDASGFWLLDNPEPNGLTPVASIPPPTAYRLSPDGKELARYDVPGVLDGELFGVLLGDQGELLLNGYFSNVRPDLTLPPPAEPTRDPYIVAYEHPYWQLAGPNGSPDLKPLDGYPASGKLYTARPDRLPWQRPTSGQIKAGDLQIALSSDYTLGQMRVFHVASDGSFYLLVNESLEDPTLLLAVGYPVIYHYSADGKLLGRARMPFASAHIALALKQLSVGPDGSLYALVPQPQPGPPDRMELHRLNIFPADQPLPTLVLPTPTTRPISPTQTLPTTPPPGSA